MQHLQEIVSVVGAGEVIYGGGTRRVPGEVCEKVLRALDLETGKIVWKVPQA